jgi:hypothetical protein
VSLVFRAQVARVQQGLPGVLQELQLPLIVQYAELTGAQAARRHPFVSFLLREE